MIRIALGNLVRRRRTGLGLSQDDLAARTDLDRTYISGIERGKRNPTLVVLFSIAFALDIPASALLDGLEEEIAVLHAGDHSSS